MKLIFLGPPGAGKGTQSERICKKYDIAHISTGDMLRAEIREGTKLGIEAKSYMDKGGLVPDEVIMGMVEARIQKPDCKNGFLFDGFPRTLPQADALSKITGIDVALNVDVPFERLLERISGRRTCQSCGAAFHVSSYDAKECDKCGGILYQRDDDKTETVKKRLMVYNEITQPLIEHYDKRGLLKTVDGDKTVDEVAASIIAALEN